MKRIVLTELCRLEGQPFKIDSEVASLTQVLKLVGYGKPRQHYTMQDAIHMSRLLDQIDIVNQDEEGILKIEEAEYEWMKKTIQDYAAMILGADALVIRDAFANIENNK